MKWSVLGQKSDSHGRLFFFFFFFFAFSTCGYTKCGSNLEGGACGRFTAVLYFSPTNGILLAPVKQYGDIPPTKQVRSYIFLTSIEQNIHRFEQQYFCNTHLTRASRLVE